MNRDQPVETEIKLRCPPDTRPILERDTAFRLVSSRRHALTTYFDTPDMRLWRHGITLRVRSMGHSHTQTIKAASNATSAAWHRGEWEWPLAAPTPDFERLTETPAHGIVPALDVAAVHPVFVTDIRRTLWHRAFPDGTAAEVSLDEGRIVAGNASEPVSELELELKSGRLGPLYRLAVELALDASLALEPASKAERGYRLHTNELPRASKADAVALDANASAASALHQIASRVIGHMMANIAAAERGDVEGIHQVRVAIRRMRAALVLFAPRLHGETVRAFNGELRRIGRVLGEARDWDVFVEQTLPQAQQCDALVAGWHDLLRKPAQSMRCNAHDAVRKELRGPAFARLVLCMAGWAEDGVAAPAMLGNGEMDRPVHEAAPELLDRVARKVAHRGRGIAKASGADLHALRKSVKKLRYGVEFLSGLYAAKGVKAYVRRGKKLQKLLGAINDAAMTPVLAVRPDPAGLAAVAPSAGSLAAWSDRKRKAALHRVPKAWRAFQETDRFW